MAHLDLSLDLEQLIHSDTLPTKTREDAKALFDQLHAPVRVVLTGAHDVDKAGLLDALLQQELPHVTDVSLYLHHGPVKTACYHYDTGETVVRETFNAPLRAPENAQLTRIDVTLPSVNLQDIAICLPSKLEEQEMRAVEPGNRLVDRADIVLWCTDAFTGVEATQWDSLPNALKDHSFLVYLASVRPLLRDRLKQLRAAAQSHFYMFQTVDLSRPNETGAPPILAELSELAQRGKAAEADYIAMFVEAHRSHIPQSAPNRDDLADETQPQEPAAELVFESEPTEPGPLHALYSEALDLVRSQAQSLVDPLPEDSDADTTRVLQICAEAAEGVAALFDAHDDTDPAFCFVKEEVLSTADRLLLMSMEQGLTPAIDAATTLLQMRRDFDFQIAAIGTASFTRSKSISPIDQPMHA